MIPQEDAWIPSGGGWGSHLPIRLHAYNTFSSTIICSYMFSLTHYNHLQCYGENTQEP